MSLQDAHRFIEQLRKDPTLLPEEDEPTIEAVIEAARRMGLTFDESELRTAHRQDWALRWLAADRRTRGDQTAATRDILADNSRANAT